MCSKRRSIYSGKEMMQDLCSCGRNTLSYWPLGVDDMQNFSDQCLHCEEKLRILLSTE
jgi:hypothetical protein